MIHIKRLIDRIIEFVNAYPVQCAGAPDILRALANDGNENSLETLMMVGAKVTDETLPYYLNVLSGKKPIRFASIIGRHVAKTKRPDVVLALGHYLKTNPEIIAFLNSNERDETLAPLAGIMMILDPEKAKTAGWAKRFDLKNLRAPLIGGLYLSGIETTEARYASKKEDEGTRDTLLKRWQDLLTFTSSNAPVESLLDFSKTEIPVIIASAEKYSAEDDENAFVTEFHVADALYRDLMVPNCEEDRWNCLNNHWHTGVYLGINIDYDTAIMRGIHASPNIRSLRNINIFEANQPVQTPSTSVAASMRTLRAEFLLAFAEGSIKPRFHGARRALDITPQQRLNVAATASALYSKGIGYTAQDMIDWSLNWPWNNKWDGKIDAISQIRCDGVVEFSYEQNGIQVCAGRDVNLWNISLPGKEHPENHNTLHTGSYNLGELCPRIQAGDTSNSPHMGAHDTELRRIPTIPPQIAIFKIGFFSFPAFFFNVETDAYLTCYVRITVKCNGGPWQYPITEDNYTTNTTRLTDWRFQEAPVNVLNASSFWKGKTTDGHNFYGNNAPFQFRIVAVDLGGNVSATFTTPPTIIPWP